MSIIYTFRFVLWRARDAGADILPNLVAAFCYQIQVFTFVLA
jgi:hypothetical protein